MRAAASIRKVAPLLALLLIHGIAHATTVNLTVQEPTGTARTAEPVTSGVPIALTDTGLSWKLMDGATEIPLKTQVLSGVRNPWLLLDFQTDLSANQTKTLQLVSQTPAVNPNPVLTFTEDATSITVATGKIQVLVKKNTFNLFDTVWFDGNGNGSYANNERVLTTAGNNPDNLPLVDNANTTYQGKGTPTAVTWEYKNSLRAVLRIDGVYGNVQILKYTTRITFYAGQSYVMVDHLIRNSQQYEERYVKVRSAKLRLGLAGTTVRATRSGAKSWANFASGSGLTLEMIPPTAVVTTGYNANGTRNNINMDVDANGGLVIGDMSYHGASFRVDFATGLSAAEQTRRAGCYAERLVALAPSSWYSDLGALGAQNFETYEDETNSYTRWGWSYPTAGVPFLAPTGIGPVPATWYPSWSYIHPNQSPESDDTEMSLMQYVRTRLRAYFDRAEGWARYVSWERVMRTDGWAYAWDSYWDGPNPVTRLRSNQGGTYTANDNSYITLNICNSDAERRGAGHMWAGGVLDYYYLTGDRSALECVADVGDIVKRVTDWRDPGTSYGSPSGYPRGEARMYLNVLRLWEATNDPVWRASADHLKAMFLQATSWDSRGFYFTNIAPPDYDASYTSRFPNGKIVCPFCQGTVPVVFYRDYLLTGDTALRQRLLDIASFAFSTGTDANGFTGDLLVMDSPTTGTAQHLSYGQWDNSDPTHVPYASSTNSWIDALVIASRLSYDGRYLAKAKDMWSHASKQYWAGGTPFATSSQAGRFVNSLEGDGYSYDDYLYPFGGDLTTTQYLFYDAARQDYVPPVAIADLQVGFYTAWSTATWTSPADADPVGPVTEYDMRYSTSPITEANFTTLGQIPTPGPIGPGGEQCADITLSACQSWYFAIKSKDAAGNWSALSNVVQAGGVCPGHGSGPICGDFSRTVDPMAGARIADVPREVEFALRGANPARQDVAIEFGIPADRAGEPLAISIYDVVGRRIAGLVSDRAVAGRRTLTWDLKDSGGSRVRNGVYFAQFRLGKETRTEKMLFVR